MAHPLEHSEIYGTNFVTRNTTPVVVIGSRSYSKYDLGQIGCPHINAARNLHKALQQLGARSLEDVAARFSPEDFVGIRGFRTTSFYALIALLEDAKIRVKDFYKAGVTVDTLATRSKKTRGRKDKKRRAA
jgi:hypothetical protein